jgi:hypothetical protein
MLKWLTSPIRWIVGRILMKAAYWTAIGTMLIPIGVLLAVEVPTLQELAFWLIIAGLVSFIAGWGYTIREEHRNAAKEKKAEQLRQIEDKEREKEHQEYLLILSEIAKGLGVSSVRMNRKLRRLAEEEALKEEPKDEM